MQRRQKEAHSNVETWNLHGLTPGKGVASPGSHHWIVLLDPDPQVVIQYAREDELWLLHPERRLIEILPSSRDLPFVAVKWTSQSDIVGLAYDPVGERIFLLDTKRQRIWVSETGKQQHPTRQSVNLESLESIEVRGRRLAGNEHLLVNTRHLPPTMHLLHADGVLTSFDVTNPGDITTTELSILLPGGNRLIHPITASLDELSGAVVAIDLETESLYEWNIQRGKAKRVAGAGISLSSSNRGAPSAAPFDHPSDIVVYQPSSFIDPKMLSGNSLKRLDQAKASRKERGIIICDTGNHLVRRIVELGGTRTVHALVGNGKAEGVTGGPILGGDLLRVVLPVPSRAAMSSTGLMAIVCDGGSRALVLSPARATFVSSSGLS